LRSGSDLSRDTETTHQYLIKKWDKERRLDFENGWNETGRANSADPGNLGSKQNPLTAEKEA